MNNITKRIMSNRKQSSIEWFIDQIDTQYPNCLEKEIQQAKKLHKQEIINAWNDGVVNWDSCKDDEQYYKDTYEQ